MRICLISTGALGNDPRAVAEAESLAKAGHEVVGVSLRQHEPNWVQTPKKPRFSNLDNEALLARAAQDSGADLFRPIQPAALPVAEQAAKRGSGSKIFVQPHWERPAENDLISEAPADPGLSAPASRRWPLAHVPGYTPPPRPHIEGSVVIAYRRSDRNPGRYLESALRSAGLAVEHREDLDWHSIDPSTHGVVVVESPLPALPVRGTNPGVPVVFWVHHGEHHVDANVRLQQRYGAHIVCLAHSWHLAYRFRGVVERMPFAVSTDLFSPAFRSFSERPTDVAFVGAHSSGKRYETRQQLLAELIQHLGQDKVEVRSGVSPEAMADLYEGAKLVVDDGAGRHLPITMRVFEATGAGALLATTGGPGIELLFEEDEYLLIGGDSAGEILETLQNNPERMARRGHERAWTSHTYDIRVNELLTTMNRVNPADLPTIPEPRKLYGLPALVDRFADAQRVLDVGGATSEALIGREVWTYEQAEDRAEPGTFHVTAISEAEPKDMNRAVAAARTAVVTSVDLADRVEHSVSASHGPYERLDNEHGTIFTFGTSGYRSSPAPDPV